MTFHQRVEEAAAFAGKLPETAAGRGTAAPADEARRQACRAARPRPTAKGTGKASAAFQRGVQALAQYIAREGHHRVPRNHAEEIAVEGEDVPVPVKLGVWITNTKTRRNTLTPDQRTALAELGVEWA